MTPERGEKGRLFGTDGIRGEAGRYPLDEATVSKVGRAVVALVDTGDHVPRVAIGRDTRQSGPALQAALEAGVRAAGGIPVLLGVLPTPGVALLARVLGADAGVVISASHNPYQDNGIKAFSSAGLKLTDEEEQAVEEFVLEGSFEATRVVADDERPSETVVDASDRYAGFLRDTFSGGLSLKGLRVVLDTANGATCGVAPAVFAGLGAEVTVIHDRPDGQNINRDCGSEHTEDLRAAVVWSGADVGLAFDGDGDRLIAVDEQGKELTGDQTLIVIAQMLKDEGRLKNDQIVSTVMSNVGLGVACSKLGIKNHAADVGDRHVLEDMQRLGAVLGGEPSGHVVVLDRHTTGDGILTGLQLVSAMLKAGRPLSELAAGMEVFPQAIVNVQVSTKPSLDSVPELAAAMKRVEAELGEAGRVLVRYSGTQSLCRVMVEGPGAEVTQEYAERLAEVVRTVLG